FQVSFIGSLPSIVAFLYSLHLASRERQRPESGDTIPLRPLTLPTHQMDKECHSYASSGCFSFRSLLRWLQSPRFPPCRGADLVGSVVTRILRGKGDGREGQG